MTGSSESHPCFRSPDCSNNSRRDCNCIREVALRRLAERGGAGWWPVFSVRPPRTGIRCLLTGPSDYCVDGEASCRGWVVTAAAGGRSLPSLSGVGRLCQAM